MYSVARFSADMSDILSVNSMEFLVDTEDVTEVPEDQDDTELSLIQLSGSEDDLYTFCSYDEQILFELQVANHLMGVSIALHIFLLALIVFFFLFKVIRYNVTDFIS